MKGITEAKVLKLIKSKKLLKFADEKYITRDGRTTTNLESAIENQQEFAEQNKGFTTAEHIQAVIEQLKQWQYEKEEEEK